MKSQMSLDEMRRIMKRRHNAMNAERIVAKGAGNREKKKKERDGK